MRKTIYDAIILFGALTVVFILATLYVGINDLGINLHKSLSFTAIFFACLHVLLIIYQRLKK